MENLDHNPFKEQFDIMGDGFICFLAELDEKIDTSLIVCPFNTRLQPAAA